tara:strand:+ start:31 stop:546 length:516 start_codon:yes stop_codon:yes gene_type:complete
MIHLNIGSNLDSKYGSRFENISAAIKLLIDKSIKVKKISNFYETPSYPNERYPKFINIGIMIDYKNNYQNLLKEIKMIEKKMGRIINQKNDPRIIDIDIIDFKGVIVKSTQLILPHPKSHLRNFVLYPILQIDPNWSHPIFKKNAQFLIGKLSQKLRIEITRLRKNVNIDE